MNFCQDRRAPGLYPRAVLFLIYINDIVTELRASVRLLADDTSLYIVVENPNTAALT